MRALAGDLMLVATGAAWGATTLVIKASSLARARHGRRCSVSSSSRPVLALCALASERVAAPPSAVPIGSLVTSRSGS
jgi:hypothetical protein